MAEKDRLCFKGVSAAVGAVRDVLRSMDTVRGNDKPHGISLQAPYNAEAYPFAVYQYRHQLYESGCTALERDFSDRQRELQHGIRRGHSAGRPHGKIAQSKERIKNKKAGAILTSAIEHHAVLRPCEAVEEFGLPVAYMWPTESGEITPAILKSYITDSTKLVSVMYVNNEIGTTQPIKQLCDIAHFYGALFHTDAVQAVGHIKINVHELKIDFLSASAHKFNGPRGIGFLYIRKGVTLSPFFHGGSQENGMRAGTENVAAIVGMSIALKENCDRLSSSQEHITMLEKTFFHFLDQSGVKYKRNGTNQMYGIISVSFPNCDGEALLHRLDLKGIYISTGSACDSKRKEVSHVLKAIQLDKIYANGTVRISLSSLNSQEEVITIAQEIIKILRNNSAGSF